MTTATFFPGSAASSSSSSSGASGRRSAAASALVHQARAGAQAAFKAPRTLASAASAYPWLTQAMLARMSPRARRLLRADC